MRVRMATLKDVDVLVRARFDYFAAEKWELSNDEKTIISSQLYKYYPEHLDRDFFAAFAEDEDGKIASTAFLVINERPANLSWPTGKTGMVLNVLTYPEYRRRGYATKIMNLLIEEAKRQDLSYIELSASPHGKPLYEKLGFQESGVSDFTDMRLPLL